MENFKKIMQKILYPPFVLALPVVILATISLIYVFAYNLDTHPFSYVAYVLSFYALCVVCAGVIRLTNKTTKYLHKNTYTEKYLSDVELRVRISLYIGTLINIGYAVFKLITGVFYSSSWFGVVAIYYIVLSLIRFFLIKAYRKSMKLSDDTYQHEWKSYRLCGILLLFLNTTMTGMAVHMVWHNETYHYPGFIIYASATYTFYRMAIAVKKVLGKKITNPILLSTKALDLSMALMAMFALQTAMLFSFGEEMTDMTRRLMNSLTGSAVCFSVLCIALFMIIKSTKKLRINKLET